MPIKFVLQRVTKASLLIDNKDQFVSIHKGLIIYICILKETKLEDIEKSIKILSNLKLIPDEKEELISIKEAPCDIMIIPQSSMGGKIKQKVLTYYSLCDKQEGEKLYYQFCELMKQNLNEKSELKYGTYGNRQELKFESFGPFTNSFEI